jgi:hypothetical protein
MSDIHSCSYHCNRPECIKAQRDELRDRLAQPEQPAKIDIDYWVSSRPQIIEALAKAGFTLMSNANGFWLEPAPQPEREPSGWKLVPLEPTQEMLRATEAGPVNFPSFCWKAMLSAAPNTPQRKPEQLAQLPQGWSAVQVHGGTTKVWPMTEAQVIAASLAQPEQESFSPEAISATQAAWKMGYDAAKAEQPEQEPVQFKCTVIDDAHPNGIPLEQWAKPPQRKPLTDEEMKKIWYAMQNIMGWYSFQEIARAIEAAHGIKGS